MYDFKSLWIRESGIYHHYPVYSHQCDTVCGVGSTPGQILQPCSHTVCSGWGSLVGGSSSPAQSSSCEAHMARWQTSGWRTGPADTPHTPCLSLVYLGEQNTKQTSNL
jgi:hypothetical protein